MDGSSYAPIASIPTEAGAITPSSCLLAAPLPAPSAGLLRGAVNLVDTGRVAGWAQDMHDPDRPVSLEVLIGTQVVAYAVADRYREELSRAGAGNGWHGFEVALPNGLGGTDGITVRRVGDGATIGTWPAGVRGRVLCAPLPFDD